jgi:hypothetical protein
MTSSVSTGASAAGATLADVEAERRQIDQPGDVVQLGGGLGDDRAAVGMPDKPHRPVDRTDVRRDSGRIEGETAQRVRRGDHRVPRGLQLTDHSTEARRIGEGAMNQNDRGCG